MRYIYSYVAKTRLKRNHHGYFCNLTCSVYNAVSPGMSELQSDSFWIIGSMSPLIIVSGDCDASSFIFSRAWERGLINMRFLTHTYKKIDLGEDSERARLGCSGPWMPVFSILNQPLLAGITVSGYVIKLCVALHNVFSWWARVKKKRITIFLIILRTKISTSKLFIIYTFNPQCSSYTFCY